MGTILVIFTVIVLPLAAVFSFLVVFPFNKIAKKKLKFRSMVLATSVISYLVLFGDYHFSNLVFKYYCSDKDFVGQFVYEKVALPEDMFVDLSKEKDLSKHQFSLVINNQRVLIDKDKFNELFEFQDYKRTELFLIGPIYQIETNVKRKIDGKILGKTISLNNKLGWLNELNLWWLNSGDGCPVHRDKYGSRIVKSDHDTLIDSIFYKKK